jgi:hypothetical protein
MSRSRVALTLFALAAVPIAFGAAPSSESSDRAPAAAAPAVRGAAPKLLQTELAELMEPCQQRFDALAKHGYAPRSLVATLPDPVDSHFRREFDMLLSSVRQALEGRYLQDRYCLPWSPAAGGAPAPPFHRSVPGVILYRRDPAAGDPGEILAVYLVGEVPAWGVQTEALRVALDLAADGLGKEARAAPPETIDLLGPTFSGSTRSLAVTLGEWRDRRELLGKPRPPLRIVSGTATSPTNHGVLDQTLAGSGYTYRTTATEDDVLQSCLWNRFVPQRLGLDTSLRPDPENGTGSGNRAVALLVESSLYGTGFTKKGFHVLPFPMHIAQLRAEYEKHRRRLEASGAAQGGNDLWRRLPNLDLDLTEVDETLDAVPVFDPNLTSRTQDLVLSNILTAIAKNRIAVAAIVASDTVDKLFLAEVLRTYAPDVRLITFEGDLLLAHPKYTSATQGMLVVSSNPLTDPDPLGGHTGGVELQFASDIAQGLFEAARSLLEGTEPPPKEVWLTTVGREALFPLERVVIAPGASGRCVELAAPAPAAGAPPSLPPPRGWALVLSLVSVLVFFTLLEAIRRAGSDDPFLGIDWLQFAPRRQQGGAQGEPPARIVQGLIVLIPVVTAVPYLLLSGPYLSRLASVHTLEAAALFWPPSWDGVVMTLMVACPAALVVTTGTLYGGLAQRTWHDLSGAWASARTAEARGRWLDLRERAVRALGVGLPLLAVTAVVLVVALFVAWGYGALRPEAAVDSMVVFFLNRSIALGSGVSPLLPILLLLLVIVGWVLASLWRHRTLDTLPPAPVATRRAGASAPSAGRQLFDAIAGVRRAVDPATFWIREYPVVWCLLALVPALYLSLYYGGKPGPLVRGFEHGVFDWLVTGLIVAAVALIVGSGLSVRCGWKSLSCWLERLKVLRLNPEGAGDESRWLEQLKELSNPGSWSRTALALGQRNAFRELRAAVAARPAAGGEADGADGLVARLRKLVADADPDNPRRTVYARTWLAIVDWIEAREEAGAPVAPAADDADGGERAPREAEVVTQARDFFVWQTGFFAREARAQLGQLMAFMTAGLLLVLLAVTSYPFEPRRVLLFYFGSLVVLGIVHSTVTLVQIGRNVVMSRLGGGSSGSATWSRSLLARLALYAGIPLLGLVTSQVPELRQLLSGWLEPVLRAFL